MTIYVVGNTKGGVGKTTIALNLAVGLARARRDVALVNGDRQDTLGIAIENRATQGVEPALPCMHYPEGPILRSQVLLMKKRYEDIVIDVGGRDSSALRAALMLADVLVVPFQPRSFDVWAVGDIGALVTEARSVRDNLLALAVLNMADPNENSTDNREAAEAIAGTPLAYLNTPLRRRKAVADASGAGLAVMEAKRRDPKAIAEFDALLDGIVNALLES